MKLVDETITAFPRVWSRSDDGVSAQLHEEDHLKPEPGKNTIVSYPSNSFRQARAVYPRVERFNSRRCWLLLDVNRDAIGHWCPERKTAFEF